MVNGWTWTDGTGGVMRTEASPPVVGVPAVGAASGQGAQPFDPYAPAAGTSGFFGPGDAVTAGLRTPYGEVHEAYVSHPPDFLERATGFGVAWGEPPPLQGFVWDSERYVYTPQAGLGNTGPGYQHFASMARQGLYVQPYRISSDESLPPWRQWALRLVAVSTERPSISMPYRVVSEDPSTFSYQVPQTTWQDPELEGKTAEEVQQILQERMARQFAGAQYPSAPGTYTTPTGHTVKVYSPEEQKAMKVTPYATWAEYVRDPTLGGKRAAQLGVDWYQMQPQTGGLMRDPQTGLLPPGYNVASALKSRIETLQKRHEWGPQAKEATEEYTGVLIEVPNLVPKPYYIAMAILAKLDLKPILREVVRSFTGGGDNLVHGQDPKAGSYVRPKSSVTLYYAPK